MAADWHVEYQDKHTSFGPAGRVTDVVDVHYIVDVGPARGHQGWVTVEQTNYSVEGIAALIQAEVDQVQAVAAL